MLIGFSMGAPVVIETAIRVPDQITGVILVDELHDVELKSTPAAISETAAFFLDLVANPTNEKLVRSGFYVNNTEASFLKISAMLKGAPRIGWEDSLLDALNWLNEGFADSVSQVQAPIISINSDMRPTNIEAFRKYVPSFQAKVVAGAGHLVMWDAPDVFNDLLEESIQEMKIHWEERLD